MCLLQLRMGLDKLAVGVMFGLDDDRDRNPDHHKHTSAKELAVISDGEAADWLQKEVGRQHSTQHRRHEAATPVEQNSRKDDSRKEEKKRELSQCIREGVPESKCQHDKDSRLSVAKRPRQMRRDRVFSNSSCIAKTLIDHAQLWFPNLLLWNFVCRGQKS